MFDQACGQLSRNERNFLDLLGRFSFRSALASIWRMPLGSSPRAEGSPRVAENAAYSTAT
jgi:hypothetical protein